MSQSNPTNIMSYKSNADLSANQYKAVKINSSREVLVVGGATDEIIGFQQNIPLAVAGAAVSVAEGGSGSAKAMAGAAFSCGAYLKLDASGRLVTGGGGGDENWAIALEAATALGDIVEVKLLQPKLVT